MSTEAEPRPFWTSYQPGLRFATSPVGSPEFFREVEQHRYRLEPHIPQLVRFDRWANADVLEVGCGIATDGVQFARAGARYAAVDPSSTALELARRRFELAELTGSFGEASATQLPFPDDTFDLVYSHGVIHHIAETQRAIREFRRVLRHGGEALVMLYHRDSLNYRVNIMLVRRLFAAALLVPSVGSTVSRLLGEGEDILEGHRELLHRYGSRYLTDAQLFLSNNTDGPGNPLSKVYSRSEARRLFADYADIQTTVRYLNLRLYPGGELLAATSPGRWLERRIGWHLYVRALKGEPTPLVSPRSAAFTTKRGRASRRSATRSYS